jgi:hypothetical protein
VPQLATSVFIDRVKNSEERLVVLNLIASSVVEKPRGFRASHVFTYRDHPISLMLNTGWKVARERVGPAHARVRDLKHTLGGGCARWG